MQPGVRDGDATWAQSPGDEKRLRPAWATPTAMRKGKGQSKSRVNTVIGILVW